MLVLFGLGSGVEVAGSGAFWEFCVHCRDLRPDEQQGLDPACAEALPTGVRRRRPVR
jgi:hypothetical protein